jgi:fumarate reductase flavoprotein subunit
MKKFSIFILGLFFALSATLGFAADKTYNVDLCIVGAGAGGLSAGMAATDAGLKTLILEKMPILGGGGNYMEGTFAVNSKMQQEDQIDITVEQQFKRVMDFHHWRINANALNHWLKETANTISWLQDHGVTLTRVRKTSYDSPRTWHMFQGGHGTILVRVFSQKIKAKGGTILTETPAKSLIIKNGRVTGVNAVDAEGDKITVHAKAVILATGGFSDNKEMVKKYLKVPYEYAGPAGRDGDGIRMLQQAGADLVNMPVVMEAGLWLKNVPTDEQFGQDSKGTKFVRLLAALTQPYLKVSHHGDRVVDENQSLEYVSNAFEEVGGEGFAVFDENTKEEMENVGLLNGYFGMVDPLTKFNNFDKVFAEAEKLGCAFKANTLAGLAKETGMDPKALEKTAADMNRFYEQKYDSQYYKDPKWLRPVKRGPFYAILGHLRMYATTGGARVNDWFQPIDHSGKIIPGLYAIGQDAGGLYSDSYDMHIAPGTASAWAIGGGRLAVKHFLETHKM